MDVHDGFDEEEDEFEDDDASEVDDEFRALIEAHLRDREAEEEAVEPTSRGAPALLRVRDRLGFLPLHNAIFYHHPPSEIEHSLKEWPESIRERTDNEDKDLPIHVACRALCMMLDVDESSDDEIEEMRQIVRILVEKWPESLRETNDNGQVPLHWVNDPATAKYLLEKCPDAIRHQDNDGMLPIHIATRAGYPLEVIHVLVGHWKPSVCELDNMACTPLHHITESTPVKVVRYLAHHGANALLVADVDGNLPLHCALMYEVDDPSVILSQQVAIIRASPLAALRVPTRDGCLPLLLAVRRRLSTRVVKALLMVWPDAIRERSTSEGLLALHEAAFVGYTKLARHLLMLWPESIRGRTLTEGHLALHKAVLGGSINMVNLLLNGWPDSIREKTNEGWLPLHLAVQVRPSTLEGCTSMVTMAEDLIKRFPGSIGEATDDDKGYLPLHAALTRGRDGIDWDDYEKCRLAKNMELGFVRILVWKDPAMVRTPSKEGVLPLHYALQRGISPQAVQLLVEKYPESLHLTCPETGCNALHMAVARHEDPSLAIVQNLIAQRPQLLQETDLDGSLPIHVAVSHKQPLEIVRFLVEQKPESLEAANNNGSLAVHIAVSQDLPSVPIVEFLVQKCPGSLDMADMAGALPLHVAAACETPSPELIRLFVQHRPDSVRQCDKQGRLALDVAAAHRAPRDVLRLLKERGPDSKKQRTE